MALYILGILKVPLLADTPGTYQSEVPVCSLDPVVVVPAAWQTSDNNPSSLCRGLQPKIVIGIILIVLFMNNICS